MLSYDDKNAELNKCFKRYFKNSKTLGAFDMGKYFRALEHPSKGPVAKC